MRIKNIKISLELPVPSNEPDENGFLYSEAAIIKACKNANGKPLIIYNAKNERVPIGTASNVRYKNGNILVDGVLWYGGTMEYVKLDKNKIVSMEIEEFGFVK